MTRTPDSDSDSGSPCRGTDAGWTLDRVLRLVRVLLGILVALATLARTLAAV